MFDQFPSNSGLPLWPGTAETKNEFIGYLTGGFGLIFLMCLGLAYASSRSKSSVIILPPNEEVEDEKSLHKYLLVLTTSLKPGASCSSHAKVFIQMVGQKVKSKYYIIKVFSSNRFLLQRGNTDILLIRTKDYLGPLQEVKVVVLGLKTVTWRPTSVSVTCMTTGETYPVDCRLINANNTAAEGDDGQVLLCSDNKKLWSCHAILRRIVTFHPWLSPFNVPLRFGKFTPVVSTNLIFLALSLLMTLTLVGYILTSDEVTDNFSMEIEFVIMAVVVELAVNLIMYLLNVLLRNVKSGKKEMIENMFPKSDMTDQCVTNGEHYYEKQAGKMASLKNLKSPVYFSITNFPSTHSRMSDTNVKSFISIDLQQPEKSDHLKPDKQLSGPYQSLREQEDITDVGIKGQGRTGNRDVFKSCTGFEVHHLEGDSQVQSSTSGRLDLDMNTSLTLLGQFRDIEQDSNNSAGTDGENTRKGTDGKKGGNNTKSLTVDKTKYAQGVGKVDASMTSVFGAERFDEFKFLSATSEQFLNLEAESEVFLDVSHSESKMNKDEPLHSVSDEWPSNVYACRKYCAPSPSLPCNHTVTQSQTLQPIAGDLQQVGCVGGTVQGTRTEESIGSSSFLSKCSFSKPKTEESGGSSLSKPSEDSFLECSLSKPIIPTHHINVHGKVQHTTAQKQYTNLNPTKDEGEDSPTFQASVLAQSEDLLSSDQVSIHMYTTGVAESADTGERFFDIENRASDNQFYSISFDRQSSTDSWVRDEPVGPHSVLLSQRQTNVTSSQSGEVQQQINGRLAQLQRKARTFSLQLLMHFCETRRLLLTNVQPSIIFNKTKVAARTWMASVIEEQVFSVLHTNRIFAIQKDPLAVKTTSLHDEVLDWPLSQSLGARCVRQCMQSVCEAMTLSRHPDSRQRLDTVIQDTLTQHLHHFTQQFYDHLKQTSKWTDMWPSVSTEDSTGYNIALPPLYVSQSSSPIHTDSVNCPTPMISKSTEYVDTHLQDLSSFYIECVQKSIFKDGGDNFSVSVIPMSTCSTEDEDEVHVLLGPPDTGPELSQSFMELPMECQLYRTALDGAMKELWLEYQDPIPVYTTFLMQAVTLDKLKNVLTWNLTSDPESVEALNVKQKIHENNSGNIPVVNQEVEDVHGLTPDLRTTPSERLATLTNSISRRFSLIKESTLAIIPLLLKKSDTKELSTAKKTLELHPLISCLDKKWHKLGFHHRLNVNKNLAQTLMAKLVKDWQEKQDKSISSKESLVLENVSCLCRIENALHSELAKYAAAYLERWCYCIQDIAADCGTDTERARDQVCAVVDVASQEMLASLQSIVWDTVNREMVKFTATQTVKNSISHAVSNLDTLQTSKTGETVTSYEMDLAELIKEFLPLKAYLTRVTKWEKLISKELIQANYLDRYQRKHNNFAVINLQHVLDSYYVKDPNMLDTTLTNDTLQQLEWHVLHENTKVIPSLFGRLVTLLLFGLIVFGLVYVTLIGGSLTVTQIQEWMSCFCISVALYGFVLEPFIAMVGYLGY